MKPDQERVHALLVDTVTLLCKNGLNFAKGLKVEGVLGITVDEKDVFIVHINEFHHNEMTVKVPPSTETATSQEAASLTKEQEDAVSPSRKRRRHWSGSPSESKPPDKVLPELPANDSTVSDLTQDGGSSYHSPDCFNPVAPYEEDLLKAEKSNDEEVIFVKTEEPESLELYDDPTVTGIPSLYCNQSTDSSINCEPHLSAVSTKATICKGAPRNFQGFPPVQRLKPSLISQPSFFSSDVLSGTASNSEADSAFKYEMDDDPNSGAECDSLPYTHWGNSAYAPNMDPAALGPKHQYPQFQSMGVRNDVTTASTLPRRSSDSRMWQVVSRFICNFPSCALSFSTKQNLLRHQTQKHGRQKSRIVGQTRRFLKPTDSLCDSL